MASSADLAKVGREAFALLDEFVGRKSRPRINQNHHLYQYATSQGYIDCNKAAKIYGGVVITDYPDKKPPNPTTRNNGFSREMNDPQPRRSIIREEFTVITCTL